MGVEFELVLPCYNESASLPIVVTRTLQVARQHGLGPERFQLIVVDNGSTDATPTLLRTLQQGEWGNGFRVVRLAKNQGYGGGLKAGLEATRAPVIGFSHADLQCDPGDVFRALFVQRTRGGLVKGKRYGRKFSERVVSRVFDFCARAFLGLRAWEINAQPKVFPRELLKRLKHPPVGITFDLYVLFRAQQMGLTLRSIAVRSSPRTHGRSHWSHSLASRWRTYFATFRNLWHLRRLPS